MTEFKHIDVSNIRAHATGDLKAWLIKDAVNDLNQLRSDFPAPSWPSWAELGDEYQVSKRTSSDIDAFPPSIQSFVNELMTPKFLGWLESLTGIKGLIPDPYFEGGGLHQSGPSGVLAPHTDFHIYNRLNLYRRLNLLIYCGEDWQSESGGELGIWLKGQKAEKPILTVDPVPGTAFLFNTSDKTIHGFCTPVGPNYLRNSIALYYYTAIDDSSFSGDYTTHWNEEIWNQQESRGVVWRIRMALHRASITLSRAFSLLAHLLNPRQGRSWYKQRKENLDKLKREL